MEGITALTKHIKPSMTLDKRTENKQIQLKLILDTSKPGHDLAKNYKVRNSCRLFGKSTQYHNITYSSIETGNS